MSQPHADPHPFGKPHDPVAFHTARLDADLQRFEAGIRRGTWRFVLASVIGALAVVTFGVWGFGIETNTRNSYVLPALLSRPAGPAVMVIIRATHPSRQTLTPTQTQTQTHHP